MHTSNKILNIALVSLVLGKIFICCLNRLNTYMNSKVKMCNIYCYKAEYMHIKQNKVQTSDNAN